MQLSMVLCCPNPVQLKTLCTEASLPKNFYDTYIRLAQSILLLLLVSLDIRNDSVRGRQCSQTEEEEAAEQEDNSHKKIKAKRLTSTFGKLGGVIGANPLLFLRWSLCALVYDVSSV